MVILRELGVGAERGQRDDELMWGKKLSQADVGRFWAAVERSFDAKYLRASRKANFTVIFMLPHQVVPAALRADPELERFSVADLRMALQTTREWVDGHHRQRFNGYGKTGGVHCWAFAVDDQSPPVLQRIAKIAQPPHDESPPPQPQRQLNLCPE